MTFFARNSSFTVLGTGECVRCNRSLLNIVSCGAKNWFFCCCCCFCFFFFRSVRSRFPALQAISLFFLSEFSSAPCDSFLVSDWTLYCFLRWFDNTLEKSTLMECMFSFFFNLLVICESTVGSYCCRKKVHPVCCIL